MIMGHVTSASILRCRLFYHFTFTKFPSIRVPSSSFKRNFLRPETGPTADLLPDYNYALILVLDHD